MTKLQYGHECVSSNTSQENEYLQTISVTLKVGTWVLVGTFCLDVEDIYAYLFYTGALTFRKIFIT
jgi:hypothetical protein